MVKCINQIFRPSICLSPQMRFGRGDCTVCKADEKNKDCDGFVPVILHEIGESKNSPYFILCNSR